MLFALFADRSNLKSDFCGKGPLFLERVTYNMLCANLVRRYVLRGEGGRWGGAERREGGGGGGGGERER